MAAVCSNPAPVLLAQTIKVDPEGYPMKMMSADAAGSPPALLKESAAAKKKRQRAPRQKPRIVCTLGLGTTDLPAPEEDRKTGPAFVTDALNLEVPNNMYADRSLCVALAASLALKKEGRGLDLPLVWRVEEAMLRAVDEPEQRSNLAVVGALIAVNRPDLLSKSLLTSYARMMAKCTAMNDQAVIVSMIKTVRHTLQRRQDLMAAELAQVLVGVLPMANAGLQMAALKVVRLLVRKCPEAVTPEVVDAVQRSLEVPELKLLALEVAQEALQRLPKLAEPLAVALPAKGCFQS